MTNGELFFKTFPCLEQDEKWSNILWWTDEKGKRQILGDIYDSDFWNAEYKEPVIRDNGVKDELESTTKNSDTLEWLGKNCKDCGNEKCKKLGTLPKGYDCALWQPKVENYSIKTVTNAKEAENYPISEDISKGIEEINKLIFENGQVESER